MRNSCLPEIDNAGTMMTLDENPQCSFQILRPAAKKPKFGVGSTVTAKSGTIPHKIQASDMRNSCLPEIDNAGAMMTLDENPQCSFQILRPAAKKPKFGVGSTVTAKSGTIPHKIKPFFFAVKLWTFILEPLGTRQA
ncbi:uncharacterized protein [Populus alba]|nr:uncharacterized protein LOC118048842 [Populus alba]XP_034914557.1 uncharacterized protein LOC118048842 [Populus alba]XP_034914558.1 uncharacterized protein LOC118048842 [Populus alba]